MFYSLDGWILSQNLTLENHHFQILRPFTCLRFKTDYLQFRHYKHSILHFLTLCNIADTSFEYKFDFWGKFVHIDRYNTLHQTQLHLTDIYSRGQEVKQFSGKKWHFQVKLCSFKSRIVHNKYCLDKDENRTNCLNQSLKKYM